MAKAQGKKAAAAASGKGAAKKVAAKVRSAARAVTKKLAPKKKAAAPAKPTPKKAAPKPPPRPAPKPTPKAAAKPAPKAVAKAPAKAAAKAPAKNVAKTAAKAAARPATKAAAKVKSVAKAAVKKVAAKIAPKTAAKKAALEPKAVPPTTLPSAPVAPNVPAVPKAAPAAPAPEPEKKRGRRARTRITSSGAPAASWLTSEKPRPASFIAAPARAEAPSAIAAPPASSDRLIREEDLAHPAVRTVPVRIDVEQGAGRFYVIANPSEVTVRPGEGIEWDFRYIGGADVNVEEIVIELEKPSPFAQTVFRTKKPGGARPHRQLSGGVSPAAAGKRLQYTVRAMNQFKTELASTRVFLTITA